MSRLVLDTGRLIAFTAHTPRPSLFPLTTTFPSATSSDSARASDGRATPQDISDFLLVADSAVQPQEIQQTLLQPLQSKLIQLAAQKQAAVGHHAQEVLHQHRIALHG